MWALCRQKLQNLRLFLIRNIWRSLSKVSGKGKYRGTNVNHTVRVLFYWRLISTVRWVRGQLSALIDPHSDRDNAMERVRLVCLTMAHRNGMRNTYVNRAILDFIWYTVTTSFRWVTRPSKVLMNPHSKWISHSGRKSYRIICNAAKLLI